MTLAYTILNSGLSDLDSNYQLRDIPSSYGGYKHPLSPEVTGLHITFMFVESIIYSLVVLAIEYEILNFSKMLKTR